MSRVIEEPEPGSAPGAYIEQTNDRIVGEVKPFWPAGRIEVQAPRSRKKYITVKVEHWRGVLDENGKQRLGPVSRKEVPPHLYLNLRDPNRRKYDRNERRGQVGSNND